MTHFRGASYGFNIMNISWSEAFVRLLVVFGLVFGTYNPSGYSYVHWLIGDGAGPLALKVAIGILLLIIFYVLLTVTYSVFRPAGLIVGAITAILFNIQALFFGLRKPGLTTFDDYFLFIIYVLLMSVAVVIGFGVSWSKFTSGLSGQEAKRYVRRGN